MYPSSFFHCFIFLLFIPKSAYVKYINYQYNQNSSWSHWVLRSVKVHWWSDIWSSAAWSCHLDGWLAVNTKQCYIGHSNESPLLTGPEFHHRALLWSFRGCIEISEAHTAKVGGQADQNVPTDSKNIIFINDQKHQKVCLEILLISTALSTTGWYY